MKFSRITIWIILAFFTVLLILILSLPLNRHLFWGPLCAEKAYLEETVIDAVIISKFNDYSNHNYPTIGFQDLKTKSNFKVYFVNERSGFYNIIQTGDTVYKKIGSLDIITSNQNVNSPLIYDCDDEKTK